MQSSLKELGCLACLFLSDQSFMIYQADWKEPCIKRALNVFWVDVSQETSLPSNLVPILSLPLALSRRLASFSLTSDHLSYNIRFILLHIPLFHKIIDKTYSVKNSACTTPSMFFYFPGGLLVFIINLNSNIPRESALIFTMVRFHLNSKA